MRQLVMKLPSDDSRQAPDKLPSDNTITAVLATLYEVIKKNPDFAQYVAFLVQESRVFFQLNNCLACI